MKVKVRLILICAWSILVAFWLILGGFLIPRLVKVDYFKESIQTPVVDVDWLVDSDWGSKPTCNDKQECSPRSIEESVNQFTFVIEDIEKKLMKQKVVEILLTAQQDRELPTSPCSNKPLSFCLANYAQGISVEVLQMKGADSLNSLLLAVTRLKAISQAREQTTFSIPNESVQHVLALSAAALSRDIEDLNSSLEGRIERLYNEK